MRVGSAGSGLGTYFLSLLHDSFPEVYRFSSVVIPSKDDDVITSPYNRCPRPHARRCARSRGRSRRARARLRSVLAMQQLAEHADCVLPMENQALVNIVEKVFKVRSTSLATGRHI